MLIETDAYAVKDVDVRKERKRDFVKVTIIEYDRSMAGIHNVIRLYLSFAEARGLANQLNTILKTHSKREV